ncbi:MAG: hypothetical protein R3291_03075 [Thermoplasmata archaeon]|nr:hypothetical protein [Thermoplasmata archaeon]
MRPVVLILGILIALMGTVFGLQGAGLLPTAFMIGPVWIAIGSGVALVGIAVAAFGAWKG